MQSGNGIDLSAVYQLLTEVAQRVGGIETRLDRSERRFEGLELRLDDHTSKLNEIVGTINEHTRRFDRIADVLNKHDRKLDDLTYGLATLRSTVSHYHETVIGHGMMLNNVEEG